VFKRVSLFILLLFLIQVFSTESRIESMGKRDLFFKDEMSIFYNPANIGVFGSFVTGSLGFVHDESETLLTNPRVKDSTVVNGTDTDLVTSVAVDTVVNPKTATPTNQWFGVAYSYSPNDKYSVFGGAAFNREDEYLRMYDAVRIHKSYRKDQTNRPMAFPELKGKSDYILGGRIHNVNIGAGYYSASQDLIQEDSKYNVSISLNRINAGAEIGIGQHSLEVFGGTGFTTYSNDNRTADSTVLNIKATTDNSVFAGARFFLQTRFGGGLVIVPGIKYSRITLFDSTDTRVNGGIGLNYRLDGGLFWAGVEAEYYTTGDSTVSGGKSTTTGKGARFNFGIEKSLIFKWLMVRVGGNKFIATQQVKQGGITTTEWVQNPVDDGTSEDFLGFGIGLNYQNRLRFDITLNESLPYFNPFGNGLRYSSNGGHMLLRISSTFSL
jgi:hypothetical protein